jgi:hypothetical protein
MREKSVKLKTTGGQSAPEGHQLETDKTISNSQKVGRED